MSVQIATLQLSPDSKKLYVCNLKPDEIHNKYVEKHDYEPTEENEENKEKEVEKLDKFITMDDETKIKKAAIK